ncbi:hypothetical protein [Niveispirillum sp. KHB5.9]|uniref:hypothetical protein n=1 Tax=Niveispirillum sp. KHB5.9 TaxID=3400269 RepID=UPI003A837A4E
MGGTWCKTAWIILALIHILPASVLVAPELALRLYGVDPQGPVAVLIIHRGALFLAVMVVSLFAVFDPPSRRVCSIIVAISILGFLGVYTQAGLPEGPLRTIALVDLAALLPLVMVTVAAWRRRMADSRRSGRAVGKP